MARVGNELFVHYFGTPGLCSVELDSDLKLAKWRKRKFVPVANITTVHLK
ncbi:unnamed protein product [Hymenolepis diminuta]|uniref:Uncharacterized protein n=1 Tax=Hymenolepis diminuta TaxID=6216 RepID=A0A564YC82_HYMDI|nr:unnamed protein product [Hymenolepis diminuta]